MKKEQLIPLLPEVKAIVQALYPDVTIYGRLRPTSDGKFVVLLFGDEAKANDKDSNDALVVFFEGSSGQWKAFYYGIHDFGSRDGKPYAEYGMIPFHIESDDIIELAGQLSDYLLGITNI